MTHGHDEAEVRECAMQFAVNLHNGDLNVDNDALVVTYTAIYRALTQPIPDPALTALEIRIASLEERMSLSETALADLDVATNEIATELDDLRGQISSTDAALADRIGAAAERLRGLAADPENPVPAPEPTPEPGV